MRFSAFGGRAGLQARVPQYRSLNSQMNLLSQWQLRSSGESQVSKQLLTPPGVIPKCPLARARLEPGPPTRAGFGFARDGVVVSARVGPRDLLRPQLAFATLP